MEFHSHTETEIYSGNGQAKKIKRKWQNKKE
jgi:hypothetical protein